MAIWRKKKQKTNNEKIKTVLCYSLETRDPYQLIIAGDEPKKGKTTISIIKLIKTNNKIETRYIKNIVFSENDENTFKEKIKELEEIGYKNFEKAYFILENE